MSVDQQALWPITSQSLKEFGHMLIGPVGRLWRTNSLTMSTMTDCQTTNCAFTRELQLRELLDWMYFLDRELPMSPRNWGSSITWIKRLPDELPASTWNIRESGCTGSQYYDLWHTGDRGGQQVVKLKVQVYCKAASLAQTIDHHSLKSSCNLRLNSSFEVLMNIFIAIWWHRLVHNRPGFNANYASKVSKNIRLFVRLYWWCVRKCF
jgi:hypothetical protein